VREREKDRELEADEVKEKLIKSVTFIGATSIQTKPPASMPNPM
jgi:hypothetical protein